MKTRRLISTLACVLGVTVTWAADPALSIHNTLLEATIERPSGRLTLTDRASRQAFLEGQLSVAHVRAISVSDPQLGRGQALEVSSPDGAGASVQLYPGLPFAVFRFKVSNNGAEEQIASSFSVLSANLRLDRPAGELRALGTGGLFPPATSPGSYAWLAVADPDSRHGVVSGWLTHDRGSGVLFTKQAGDQVGIEARLEYGRLRLGARETTALETLAVGYFADARLGLEAWADTVARVYRIRLHPQPAGHCTWYSQPNGGASDEQHVEEQARFAAKHLAPFGFSVVQIDDGWQAGVSTNGPKRNFFEVAPHGPYPHGMRATSDHIKALGLTPGLWFMPFAGTFYDPFFAGHPDWFVQREDGQPYETDWGGTCLDLTQPAVRDYLRQNIQRIGGAWGFDYFKMDGLWTGTATPQQYVNEGYHDDHMGDAVFHDAKVTNLEAYRSGLRLVRDAAGPKPFILGCCSPQNMRSYGGAFGLVDAMRIGPDNGWRWEDLLRGPTFGSRQYFLHGRVWYNDPDPVYVRASLPLSHARLIASWVTLSGQLNLSSEWLPGLPADRLDLLKRTLPSHGLKPRPADLFETPLPRQWLLTDDRRQPRRDVVGLFNWDAQPSQFDCYADRLGLSGDTEYVGFDYWENHLVAPFRGRLQLEVPGQSCRVVAVRPVSDHPQVISTSRHITQGIVDIKEEKWRAKSHRLSGRSLVVGNDPYELRVVLPAGPAEAWQATAVTLGDDDIAERVKATVSHADGLLRVRLTSPVSREVAWAIEFQGPATR